MFPDNPWDPFSSPFKMGPIGYSEMPGKKKPYALHNSSEQRRPHQRRDVSLKSRKRLPAFI